MYFQRYRARHYLPVFLLVWVMLLSGCGGLPEDPGSSSSSSSSSSGSSSSSSGILRDLTAAVIDGDIRVSWSTDTQAATTALYYSRNPDFITDSVIADNQVTRIYPASSPLRLTGLVQGVDYYLTLVTYLEEQPGQASARLKLRPKGVNDTGVINCANATNNNVPCSAATDFPRQDGQFGRDAKTWPKTGSGRQGFDFTKLDAKGDPLTPDAIQWSCVRDNHTGLTWEVKSANPDSIQYSHWTYSWYNSNGLSNGGSAGKANGGNCLSGQICDTSGYVTAINNRGICDLRNWRLPQREELRSIIDYSLHMPSLDTQFFPDIQTGGYWTATASQNDNAWNINFYIGNSQDLSKLYDYHLMLVAGDP